MYGTFLKNLLEPCFDMFVKRTLFSSFYIDLHTFWGPTRTWSSFILINGGPLWNHEEPSNKGNGQIHQKMTLFMVFGVFMECLSNMGQSIKDLFGTYWKGLKGTSYWHLSVLIHCWKRMEIHQKGPIFMFLTCFWHVFDMFWDRKCTKWR